MCPWINHTHSLGVVNSYQATVISQLISVQIKARSMAAELCWLITGACKGFRSLSMASGPHPHSRDPVIRATEDLTGMEMKPVIVNTQLAYARHDWLASALLDFSASLQRKHLRAADWCFMSFTSKAYMSFFIHIFFFKWNVIMITDDGISWSKLMATDCIYCKRSAMPPDGRSEERCLKSAF